MRELAAMRGYGVCVAVALIACWKPFGPARPQAREFELGAQSYRMPNGLRVVIVPDPGAPDVAVTVRYRVGSVDDPPGREGTAHLVEHLMYQHVVDGETLFSRLVREASVFDGTTEREATTYMSRGPDLAALLAVEGARLAQPCGAIGADAFARERDVVRNEARERTRGARTDAIVHAAIYGAGHPYAHAAETPDSLAAITQADACAFAAAHYVSEAGVVVVSGAATRAMVEEALRPLAAVAARAAPAPANVAEASAPHHAAVQGPVDDPVLVYAWPLAGNNAERSRTVALAGVLAEQIRDESEAPASVRTLGGERAGVVAIYVAPASAAAAPAAVEACERAIAKLPRVLANTTYYDDTFDHARNLAVYRAMAAFARGAGGDEIIADHLFAGRDPVAGVRESLQALISLERGTAIETARARFARDRATTLVISPETQRAHGAPTAFVAPSHAIEARRAEDPADAARPAPVQAIRDPIARATTWTLPSGIRVIAVPVDRVPIVDLRFVYATGTGDEPAAARGVAELAAKALLPRGNDFGEMLRFYEIGGAIEPYVGLDRTVFRTRGVAGNLDRMLSAIERLVDSGHYHGLDRTKRSLAHMLAASRDAPIRAAWRTALYGDGHPYATAGLDRTSLAALTEGAAEAYRDVYRDPQMLAVVIAGDFDLAATRAWVEHVLSSWQPRANHAPPPPAAGANRMLPATIGATEDTALVGLQIGFAPAGSHAELLVTTELVADAIADVRHQLGASYGLHAILDEARRATRIVITGYVDAGRAADALTLVRERLAALRMNTPAAASAFVRARRRALAQLVAGTANAADVADRVEDAILRDESPADLARTAEQVRNLTLANVAPHLGELDLARAAILLRGPGDSIQRGFAALGRTPQLIDVAR